MDQLSLHTTYLFAPPTFLSGMGSVLDLGATMVEFNSSLTPEQADAIALRMDFEAIGADMERSLREFEDQLRDESSRSE